MTRCPLHEQHHPFTSKGSLVVSTHICSKRQGGLALGSEIIGTLRLSDLVGREQLVFLFDPRCLERSHDINIWAWVYIRGFERAMFRPSKYFYKLPPKIQFFWVAGEKQIFGTCYPKPKPHTVMNWILLYRVRYIWFFYGLEILMK